MLTKQFNIGLTPTFKMEEEGATGGGGVALTALSGGESDSSPNPSPEPTPTPGTPAPFDPAEFARTFGTTIAESLKQQTQQQPAPAPLTLEDAKKALKWWEPSTEFITKFNNLEQQQQAFAELRDGLTQQFYAILQGVVQERDQQLAGRYDPVVEFMNEQRNQARERAFYTDYPQLSHEGLKPLIGATIGHLAKDPSFKSKTEKEQFKAIASGVEAIIKQTNPTFKLEAKASQPNQGNAGTIPVTSHGAGGGGGTGGTGAPAKSKALQYL